MTSATITTIVKMLESLPQAEQQRVVEHLRDYIATLQDEAQWDEQFSRTKPSLIAAARRAKADITEGKSEPMDFDAL